MHHFRKSVDMPVAVMASEDQRFLDHRGFDFKEIRNAVAERASGKRNRGGISAENIERRISLQPKSDYYVSKCDYIINNDGSENELKTKISAFISEMKKRRRR